MLTALWNEIGSKGQSQLLSTSTSEGRRSSRSLLNTSVPLVGPHQPVTCFGCPTACSCVSAVPYWPADSPCLLKSLKKSHHKNLRVPCYAPSSLLLDKVVCWVFTLFSLTPPLFTSWDKLLAAHLRTDLQIPWPLAVTAVMERSREERVWTRVGAALMWMEDKVLHDCVDSHSLATAAAFLQGMTSNTST